VRRYDGLLLQIDSAVMHSAKHPLTSVFRLYLLLALALAVHGKATAQDDDTRVDIGGYGSFRLDADDGDHGDPAFTLRRFVVTTDARIGRKLTVYSEIEYERLTEIEIERSTEATEGGLKFEQELEGTNGSEIALEQAWGQFQFSEHVGVRFGAVLPPVGRFNTNHDDNLWNLPRRPLTTRAAAVLPAQAAWTEMGLGIVGSHFIGERARVSYEAFLLTGTSLDFAIEQKVQTRVPSRNKLELEVAVSPTQGAFDGSNTADALAGRVGYSPALGSELAVSGYVGRYTPEYLDTNELLSTFGIDGRQRIASFDIEGEFLLSTYAGIDRVLTDFAAVAIDRATETEADETAELESEIEIELSGLADKRYGFWLDVSRPIPLPRGTLGLSDAVVIPIVRYEHVWLADNIDSFDFAGGSVIEIGKSDVEQRRISIGVAFRPVPQGVFHLTFTHNDPVKGDLIDPDGSESVKMISFGFAAGF